MTDVLSSTCSTDTKRLSTEFYDKYVLSRDRKDARRNIAYRRSLLSFGSDDFEQAREIFIRCSRDLLYYVNVFCFTYDPRNTASPVIPFITYEYQDEALLGIASAIIEQNDLLFEKSRDMGASWMMLTVLEWFWHFRSDLSFLMGSRNEGYVDESGNPKSLFWKIDFILNNQPRWLRPNVDRIRLRMTNLDNGSIISGESATGNFGRGDRRTAIVLDEFSAWEVSDAYRALGATADTTACRIFNFTPQGVGNAAYDTAQNVDVEKLRLYWTSHPKKNVGLYTSAKNKLVILDKDYVFPPDYEFILDNKTRSVWFDKECKRRSPREIEQELEINYLGSGYRYFSDQAIDNHLRKYAFKPFAVGDLDIDKETLEPHGFVKMEEGPLHVWVNLDPYSERPPEDRSYVIGCDVAEGTGASNSCAQVYDIRSRAKVAEFAASSMSPTEFADYVVALCRWFKGLDSEGAFLIWEANGPGRSFGNRVMSQGYRRVFYRQKETNLSRQKTDAPGWFSTKETKVILFGEYRRALENDEVLNRSKVSLEEHRQYVFLPGGGISHAKAANSVDPTGAKESHGDRVVADALCVRAMEEKKEICPPEESLRLNPPVGSFAWRRKRREDADREANTKYWD